MQKIAGRILRCLIALLVGCTASLFARPLHAAEIGPEPDDVGGGYRLAGMSHWVSVDLSEQRLTAYAGAIPLRTFVVSTGDAAHPTWVGRFRISNKYGAIDVIGRDYYFRDVPYYMQYYYGFALHAATWHNDFGRPVSRGCVNLRIDDARWLFEFLDVGDLVYVHY